jgi:hypothetical protein
MNIQGFLIVPNQFPNRGKMAMHLKRNVIFRNIPFIADFCFKDKCPPAGSWNMFLKFNPTRLLSFLPLIFLDPQAKDYVP